MPQSTGRSGMPGNKAGSKKSIHIAMKDPMAHLKLGQAASTKKPTRS